MEGEVKCEWCYGTGQDLTDICYKCNGIGKIDWVTKAMDIIKKKEDTLVINEQLNMPAISIDDQYSDIVFFSDDNIEAIKICKNGDFYVKEKKVTNDKKLHQAFVDFFSTMGLYK